ncbi:flavin monoamine oxidase family protein [Mycobacterium aquaticum]|uniref:Amine oxidase n=1 Tax=Mycobacterium aquaticum TaxID=1927124 RepID=A0A1X0AMB2_9MYCO|nr:FAD-dependent oxidoreductase [Mycobacterium aquaticum]ORA31189.1 amine oxidase [Mycobacterium aquaticum]
MADVDVVVVGAGFGGLIAARDLRRAGAKVRVLEAADRVGGRAMTVNSAAGTPVDLGGQWIGHDHVKMQALAAEFGMALYPTHTGGRLAIRENGRDISLFSLTTVAAAAALVRLAVVAPFGVGMRDDRLFSDWLATVSPRRARRVVDIVMGELTSNDPDALSVAAIAASIRSGGGLRTMVTDAGGAQEALLSCGAGGLAAAVAEDLDDAVMLNCRVREIVRDDEGVVVRTTSGDSVRARHVVVAVAPPVAASITHSPALPASRDRAQRETFMGTIYKAVAVYESPFWRAAGLRGQFLDLDGPVSSAFDISPPGGPGHVCVLMPGGHARALSALDEDTRRETILGGLAANLGEAARSPLSFHEKSWHDDEFVLGGYNAFPRPGALAVLDGAFAPVGRVHWAGTESSPDYSGYFEGAVRSGERVAREVVAML